MLTDDGTNENEDSDADAARGGNDVLTLDAEWAYKLGVSKGTVDTLEDLLFELGISRNHEVIKGRSDQYFEAWGEGWANARRALPRLFRELNEIPVQGEWDERKQGRARRLAKIDEILKLARRFREISPGEIGQLETELNIQKEALKLEQMRDKR
jgi:hypothetical protein